MKRVILREAETFIIHTYNIADNEVHGWSDSNNIGVLTVMVWSITFVLLRYVVFP